MMFYVTSAIKVYPPTQSTSLHSNVAFVNVTITVLVWITPIRPCYHSCTSWSISVVGHAWSAGSEEGRHPGRTRNQMISTTISLKSKHNSLQFLRFWKMWRPSLPARIQVTLRGSLIRKYWDHHRIRRRHRWIRMCPRQCCPLCTQNSNP